MEKSTDRKRTVCNIGGQAVMEGVMMKSPEGMAMAVRRADGSIVTEFTPEKSKVKKGSFLGLPIVRGVVSFVESLTVGMKTITRSAELAGEDILEEPSKFELWLSEKTGKSVDKIVVAVAVVLAILMAVGMFFLLPTFISGLLLGGSSAASIWKSLTEGLVRLCIFLVYIIAIGRMKEINRLFMYHGAEHKTIACFEADLPLTPENAAGQPRLHPRCGTNYLFLVMGISILFFAAVGWNANLWLRMLTRILLLPVVAGISYEALRFGARSDSLLARIIRAPGMALQKITTKEPDEGMLEVAIAAFQLARGPQGQQAAVKETEADNKETPEPIPGAAQAEA